jgi:hypothetical protein
MTAIIVNGSTPFGSLSNAAISRLITTIHDIHRVRQAAAAAQTGAANPVGAALETGSNFGVVPSSTAGAKGADFAYALNILDDALQTLLTNYQGQITALDNGQ